MSAFPKIDISGDGGVQKEILVEGIGEQTPCYGCIVSLHYTGKLADGTVFDSTTECGEPFQFELGKGNVIKAFDLGLATMKLAEKSNLICSPEYAYGDDGVAPSIPPNSILIFEVELLGWKGEDISPDHDGSIERFILENSERRRSPNEGGLVRVHLVGKHDGKTFENRQIHFVYGEGSDSGIVEGVEIAIGRMVVGEKSKFIIKSPFAFGTDGCPEHDIPPNATVEYTIKLHECEKGLEDWKLGSEERLEQAKLSKEKGIKYYKKENYALALKMYEKCIALLADAKSPEIDELRVAAYCNQVLCYQKTNNQFEAKLACDEALKLKPNNIKALYRHGQCCLAINEYDAALTSFEKVIELEGSNKAAQNQVLICKRKIKEAYDNEKKIYANMFNKMAAADKQGEPKPESDVLAKCGEWTDEDTKREVDRAIDNNIVMI